MPGEGISGPVEGLPPPGPDWALFLDIDGTIVDIAPTPDSVHVPDSLHTILERADAALGGALALVSGRTIADIDRLFTPLRLSAAGAHGAQWRIDAGAVMQRAGVRPEALAGAVDTFRTLARDMPGLVIEDKDITLAVHFRLAPEAGEAVCTVARDLLGGLPGYEVFRGKEVVEFRPSGIHKGACVERFMTRPPFRGRVPVFVGDDLTDEDGFATVNRLGGVAIRIGPPPAHVARTAARWQCADVAELTEWLANLPEVLNDDE